MDTFKNDNNMELLNRFKLKHNPFRTTPASNPEEIIWAGFKEVKMRIENRIKRAIHIQNSCLVLNWGEYGSGKTHAAKYFLKTNVLEDISTESTLPYPILLNFPQGKEPVKELYTQVIDKLDIDKLREEMRSMSNLQVLDKCTDNYLIKNVLRLLFDEAVSSAQKEETKFKYELRFYGKKYRLFSSSRAVERLAKQAL